MGKDLLKKYRQLRNRFIKQQNNIKKIIAEGGEKARDVAKLSDIIERELRDVGQLLSSRLGKNAREMAEVKLHVVEKNLSRLEEHAQSFWRWLLELVLFFLAVYTFVAFSPYWFHVVPTGSAEPTVLTGETVLTDRFIMYGFKKPKRGDLIIFRDPKFHYSSNKLVAFFQKYFPYPPFGLGPKTPTLLLKRVIGVPGDTIAGRIENGHPCIYINGKKLEEPYVNRFPLIMIEAKYGFLSRLITRLTPGSPLEELMRRDSGVSGYGATRKLVTYDPSKPFNKQPFYKISEDKIVRDRNGNPLVVEPFQPVHGTHYDEFGKLLFVDSVDEFGPIKIPDGKYWVMGDNRQNSTDSRFWGLVDATDIIGTAPLIILSWDFPYANPILVPFEHPIGFITRLRWNRVLRSPKPYKFDASPGARKNPCKEESGSGSSK